MRFHMDGPKDSNTLRVNAYSQISVGGAQDNAALLRGEGGGEGGAGTLKVCYPVLHILAPF